MKQYLVFIIFISLFGCNNEVSNTLKKNETGFTTKNIKVTTTITKKVLFNKQILANGIVKATQKTNLHFKNSGYLQKILVKNGEFVTKRKLIATLENALLQNEQKKAEIAVIKAKQKFKELLISYNLTDNEINNDTRQKLAIQAELLQAKNQLETARINYRNSLLYAPFPGIIANAQANTNKLISPTDTIVTIINPASYQVVFKIMENEIPFIKKGLEIEVQAINDNQIYTAVINDINPIVDNNGTITIKAKITSKKHPFIEGMHTILAVNLPIDNMIVIPKQALVIRNGKEVVFTVKDGNSAKWNYVNVFDENTKYYAISKGLKEGDTIIVSNNMNLAHDAVIEIENITEN